MFELLASKVAKFLAMAKETLIIGDSNVARFYTRIGQLAQGMDFSRARNLAEMTQCFDLYRASKVVYKVVVLAFISNLIVAAGDDGTCSSERLSSIEELFNEIIPAIRF